MEADGETEQPHAAVDWAKRAAELWQQNHKMKVLLLSAAEFIPTGNAWHATLDAALNSDGG